MKFEVEIKDEETLLKLTASDKRASGLSSDFKDITEQDIIDTLTTSIGCFGFNKGDIYVKRIR